MTCLNSVPPGDQEDRESVPQLGSACRFPQIAGTAMPRCTARRSPMVVIQRLSAGFVTIRSLKTSPRAVVAVRTLRCSNCSGTHATRAPVDEKSTSKCGHSRSTISSLAPENVIGEQNRGAGKRAHCHHCAHFGITQAERKQKSGNGG
jgi:hypothetical protein